MSCKTSRKKYVCRSCIQECSDFKSIYSPRIIMGEHTTLAAVMSYCTGLDFPEDEIFMPPNVCSGCMDSLMNFYAFKRSVIKADQIFRHQHEIGSAKNWHAPVVPSCDLQQEQCTDQTYEVEELKYNMDPLDTQSPNELEDDDDREFTFLEDVQYVDEVDEEEEEEFKVDPPTVNDHKAVKTSKNKGTKRSGDPEVQYETADNYNRSCQASPLVIVKVESEQGRRRPQSDCTPVKCNLCRVVFQSRQDYEGHLCLQNSPSLLKCQICNKTYRRKISLREHMRIHTGADKPYLCYICGKGLTQSSGYKKHMLTHTGEKPYTCDTCGRDFRYSSNLLIHKRRHTGERNYNCTLCSKKFYTSEKLKRHMIVHTHERLFGCEECGISFRFRTMLIDHRRIHEANKKGSAKRKAVKPANFE